MPKTSRGPTKSSSSTSSKMRMPILLSIVAILLQWQFTLVWLCKTKERLPRDCSTWNNSFSNLGAIVPRGTIFNICTGNALLQIMDGSATVKVLFLAKFPHGTSNRGSKPKRRGGQDYHCH